MKFNVMSQNDGWEPAAQALREELAEYGGLFQLLEEQKGALLSRDLEKLTNLNKAIEEQVRYANELRQKREQILKELVASFCPECPEAELKQLVQNFPSAVRPMFGALLEEAEKILKRVQASTRRNRALLARAGEVQEQVLRKLK